MPTINNPSRVSHLRLKEVRDLCGLTQTCLAAKLGVSTAAITAIEVGNLPLSKKMAGRVGAALGVLPDSLLSGGVLLGWDGSPFTGQSQDTTPTFKAGEVSLKPVHNVMASMALMEVHSFLRAAVIANKLPIACFLIREQVLDLVRELGVAQAFLASGKHGDFLVRDIVPGVAPMVALRLKKSQALATPTSPAESSKTSKPQPASPARGSGGKAS